MSFYQHFFLFLTSTFAAFYGSILGGGSFLIFPVLFLFGIDPKVAIATNATAATGYLLSSSYVFYKRDGLNWEAVKNVTPFLFVGGVIGSFLLIKMDSKLILILVTLSIIIFALVNLFKRKSHLEIKVSPKRKWMGALLAIPLGIYNVTISAGTATVLTYMLVHFQGLTIKKAIMTRPFISIPVLFMAALIFSAKGLVDWELMIPLFSGWLVGAFLGAHTVVRMKNEFLSAVFNIAVVILAIYAVWQSLN